MTTFVDTSALLALLDADEDRHGDVASAWQDLTERDERLLTTSYVLVETHALTQRRLGIEAVRALVEGLLPLLDVVWVDADIHAAAVAAHITAARRGLSLVDCASFELMRRQGVSRAFTLDGDFAAQGFDAVPG